MTRRKKHSHTANVESLPTPGTSEQSGDLQGLPAEAEADSESVQELLEEDQPFEADAIAGVESSPDPDVAEVTTKEIPEDDVPPEYLENA
jgi:hypothetical protein